MAEQILIELLADASKLEPAIEILRKAGKITKEDEEALAKMATSYNKAFDQGNKSAAATIPTLQKVEKAAISTGNAVEQALVTEIKKLTTESAKTVKSLSSVEKALGEGVRDALKEAGVSVEEFEAVLKDAGITTDEFGNMLVTAATGSKEFEDAVKKTGAEVQNTEGKTKSFRTQLKELKASLSEMEAAGLDGTKAFHDMALEAASLEDQIGDTAERVRVLASDTANIDAGVQGIQLLASGYQIASGASQLLGANEEDLQKAMVKLNAIMAITQGLQQVQQFLRGQSILAIKAEAAVSYLSATAQKVYAIAVGTSTGAMKLFRVALLATGIGAIIALLAFAAEKMGLFGDSTDDAADKLKKEKDAAEKLTEALEGVASATEKARNANKGGIDGLSRELEILKAQGSTKQEIFNKEQDLRQKELFNLRVRLTTFKGNKEKELEIAKSIADKQNEIMAAGLSFQKDIDDKLLDQEEKSAEKRKAAREKAAEKQKELQKRNSSALNDIVRLGLENQAAAAKEVAENETLGFEVRNNAAIRYLDLQKKLVENEYALAIAGEKTSGEIQLAQLQRATALEKINSDSANAIYKIWKDNNKQVADVTKAPEVEDVTKEQANALLKIVDDGLKQEVKKVEDAEKAKADLRKKAAQAILGAVQEGSDAAFEIGAERRQRELEEELNNLSVQKTAELDSKNLSEQNKADINKKYAEKERQIKLKAFEDDKKAKRNQAIINGFLAIANILATAPFLAWPFAIPAAAITTALQVAKINASKPGFKKGTRNAPRGYAWTGEEGPELVYLNGGEKIYTYNQSRKVASGWEGGSQASADQILNGFAFNMPEAVSDDIMNVSTNTYNAAEIDYEKLGRAMAKHIPSPTIVQNNLDKDGFTTYIKEKMSRTEIRNKRYNT